jgi:RecA/RadA recombinase
MPDNFLSFPTQSPYQDWGFKFTGGAIDNFICQIEGKAALETCLEFCDRRKYAENLMFELFSQTHYLFYLTRQGKGKELGEQILGLTIATDLDGLELPERLEERGLTLGLIAAVKSNGYGGLKILSTRLLSKQKGKQNTFSAPFYLRLRSNYQYRIGVPLEAIERITVLPLPPAPPTEQQLKAWKAFVGVEERLAREKQFCVSFVSHNYGEATRNITFKIDPRSATVDSQAENRITIDDFWQRAKRACNQNIKLRENDSRDRDGRELGTIESIDSEKNFLKISLDSEVLDSLAEGHYSLPQEGLLTFEAVGDLAQIGRKKKALQDLERGRSQNPYLGQFLFDANQARESREAIEIQPQNLLLENINPSQKAAVETVLSAPDLALIQGPPGTGKTTVIAEICYQVALQGGRTLIASQANLAVDNALSRLQHNPVIRAVRKGNKYSVGIEGKPFLEENIISNWLQNTSTDCEQRLNEKLKLAEILSQLLASAEQFNTYLTTEEKFESEQKQLIADKEILETNYRNKLNAHAIAQYKQEEIESLLANLEFLLDSQSARDWDQPWLEHLNPYLKENESAQKLEENVRLAINIVTEFNFAYPDVHFLAMAKCFEEGILENIIKKTRQALEYVDQVARKISTLNSKQKIFKQNNDYFEKLQETCQQKSVALQKQQKKILKIQSRHSEIAFAQIELDEWSSDARRQIKTELKKCLQERRTFSEDLINFPNQLQSLISTIQGLSLHQKLQKSLNEFNALIGQYRQWDKIYTIVNKLEKKISYLFDTANIAMPSEKVIHEANQIITARKLDYVSATYHFQNIVESSIRRIEKQQSFWKQVIEVIVTVASELGWCKPSQRKRTIAILEAVRRQTDLIVRGSEPNNSSIVIESVTPNIVNSTVTNTHNWLNELDTQTEQQLQLLGRHLNELEGCLEEVEKQISEAQEKLTAVTQDVEVGINSVNELLQKLTEMQQIPTQLKDLAHEYLQNPTKITIGASELSVQVNYWQNSIDRLEILIALFAPLDILLSTKSKINNELENQNSITLKAQRELRQSEQELNQINTRLQQHLDNRKAQRYWWQEYWQTIPEHLKPEEEFTDLLELNFLRRFKLQFEVWRQELGVTEAYLNRYQNLISDWIEGLKNPSEQNRQELRRIYLDNANVIGITCSQSAKGNFSKEFESFDVIIIDEVSKCTPPELLIPALKAKKLVLVGDHRQLPPMLNNSTIEEIAEELGTTTEELNYLKESLFKNLFESAPESIKKMLTIQYRMHPQIMAGINQFYENNLECGLTNPNEQRTHHLANSNIQNNNHIVWIQTPLNLEFREQQDGTSVINEKEIEVIEKICQQFEQTWSVRVNQGQPRKEIGIITFYGRQLKLIESRIDSKKFPSLHIRTGTVDRFQGMERQVIIVSMVRNNNQKNIGFAEKSERVNVAFSRAQELLVIVGCHPLFTKFPIYSKVAHIVNLYGGLIDVSDIL